MARLWRMVMAAVLTVHLVVGCCAHHSHACEIEGQMPATPLGSNPGECSHESGCQGEHGHPGPQECQGGKCSFVFRAPSASHALGEPLPAFVAILPEDRPSVGGLCPEQLALASGRLLLPVRLHLANQVLLI